MNTKPRETRRLLGCGYEPALEGATPWAPPLAKLGYKHALPTVCAGYTTHLPDVLEVARAHAHWSKGSLQAFCGREPPTDNLLALVEILDGELAQSRAYAMTPKKDGGGRD